MLVSKTESIIFITLALVYASQEAVHHQISRAPLGAPLGSSFPPCILRQPCMSFIRGGRSDSDASLPIDSADFGSLQGATHDQLLTEMEELLGIERGRETDEDVLAEDLSDPIEKVEALREEGRILNEQFMEGVRECMGKLQAGERAEAAVAAARDDPAIRVAYEACGE